MKFPKPRCILPPNKVMGSGKDYSRRVGKQVPELTEDDNCPYMDVCNSKTEDCPSHINNPLDLEFSCEIARGLELLRLSIELNFKGA